jgi:hypothetical protein
MLRLSALLLNIGNTIEKGSIQLISTKGESVRHKKIIFGHATIEVILLVRRMLLSSILVLFSFNLFTVDAQSITNIEILDIEKIR